MSFICGNSLASYNVYSLLYNNYTDKIESQRRKRVNVRVGTILTVFFNYLSTIKSTNMTPIIASPFSRLFIYMEYLSLIIRYTFVFVQIIRNVIKC